MAAMVFGTMALAFDAYFADAAGNKLGTVWEGQRVYIVIKDPEKGACGIDKFQADITVFDWKTGAFLAIGESLDEFGQITPDEYFVPGAWFRELGGIGSGLYFWVAGPNSSTKVSLEIGSREDFSSPTDHFHILGAVSPSTINIGTADVPVDVMVGWADGNWEYLDQNIFNSELPQDRVVVRTQLEASGRFVNGDTLILIARDLEDERNVDQDQIKIARTEAKISVSPARFEYGCGPACQNIVVTIEDPDENLNSREIEYVPFFVIINPGSWNPTQTAPVTNFCNLLLWGPYNEGGSVLGEPIRWYNIYDQDYVYMDYANAAWWNSEWGDGIVRAVFFAAETGPDTGVFKFDFGNLEDFMAALGLSDVRFPVGTTIHFYYIDPNDPSDMDLTFAQIGNRPLSQTFITDANGVPLTEVKLGAGWGGIYIRVYDADANVEACCQDKVVVHICAPHFEDDSEYIVIDEISNNSGIFFTQTGIPLLPVWDAVAGYQLVFDDWKIQAFNGDTIFVQYNSVDYYQADLNWLGDGDPNTGDGQFPPRILDGTVEDLPEASRNQYWDVSFAKVKVYSYEVFDGTTHRMRFLDGNYQPVTTIPLSGSLYLEVTDLDQNEHPMMRELIFGGWNKAANDSVTNTAPIWGEAANTVFGWFFGEDSGELKTRLGNIGLYGNDGRSISGINPTVKIFMFNAQSGAWERMDLRETAVGSGIFRSTTCVLVADARFLGQGNLGSKPGDTIMAFYQDPSNHSDIAIISIKVAEGGAGEVTPPTVALSVAFDRTTYYPGDTVTITVTDEQYSGAAEIVGTNVLVLYDKDGDVITSWNRLEAVAGQPGKFRVTYVLPEDVKLGTITAKYTDPFMTTRTAQAQATVVAKALANVTGITISPNPFSTSTTFTIQAEPAGAVAAKITIVIYDLTGAKVAEITGQNTASVTWNGGNLRNGAYIYVATVEGGSPTKTWTFKGFVYIER